MRLPPFPPLVWIVILGTFMVRTSFFMVWPFLSILLYREYGLSASGIGMLLGGAAVLSCLIGFYVGWLSDRLGRRTILLLGCALSCGAYLLLGFGHSLWLITLGVFGSGLSYAFIDTPGKALMGDLLPEKALRELALHLRYFLLNVGAGVGPLIGVMVGLGAR
ncbi:TPA: MFS transporter, partial [Aeromonas dhakensis]|nr:MFS transporter [Aeromonas dhakensis]